jgi:hypothetical protein
MYGNSLKTIPVSVLFLMFLWTVEINAGYIEGMISHINI